MNRDIITADIQWKEDTTPYIDLKVEIKEDDYKRNIYIEDIKLYNQNTFVNPTNPNGGISIINVPEINKNYWYQKTSNKKDELFEKDNNGIYKKVDGNYVLIVGEYGGQKYSFHNDKYYYKNQEDEYELIDFEHNTEQDFYTKNLIYYEYKDLQNDSPFKQNFDINNDIIIISVKIHPNPDDKCESDYILKAIYNKRLLLLESMAGVREINDTCTIPRRFIDFILRQKAIDLAQANNDVDLLCKYFRMFSGSIGTNKIEFAPCGCLRG